MAYKIRDNLQKFVQKNQTAMDRAINRMAVDVERNAKFRVPVSARGGHLKASGTHRRVGFMRYTVEFNKEYAAYQEYGGDGKRVVRRYTTPGTGKHYLSDAGKTVAKNALGYIKQEFRSIRV